MESDLSLLYRMIPETSIARPRYVRRLQAELNKAKLPTHVELDSTKCDIVKDSVILLEQLRTIDKKRLKDKVCHVDREIIEKVDKALLISLELST